MQRFLFFSLLIFLISSLPGTVARGLALKPVKCEEKNESVILLHGLLRTSRSMKKIEEQLSFHGYNTLNINYKSRKHTIEELANTVVHDAIQEVQWLHPKKIHLITHSMGGILVRYYFSQHERPENLGKIIMICPPNQGSEIVDKLRNIPGFDKVTGPAGKQLGTEKDSIVYSLGEVDYKLGIIMGNKSTNPLFSMLIPGKDDGKVSVENAKVKGMGDFLVLPRSHLLMMRSNKAIQQILYFLEHGQFYKKKFQVNAH
jgi:triacylglycerol lipase